MANPGPIPHNNVALALERLIHNIRSIIDAMVIRIKCTTRRNLNFTAYDNICNVCVNVTTRLNMRTLPNLDPPTHPCIQERITINVDAILQIN